MAAARAFFLTLVALATLAFLWLVAPFSGAILWAVIAAVIFEPLNARLLRKMPGYPGLAAFAVLLVIAVVVVVPAMLLTAALIGEASDFYLQVRSGEVDLERLFVALRGNLPDWAGNWLSKIGIGDVNGLQTKVSDTFTSSFETVAGHILSIGQDAFGFFLALGVMLYLTFFLLRDGHALVARIGRVVPLDIKQRTLMLAKFVAVIRATIKGGLIVAILQGATGGLVFWAIGIPGPLLWGVAMGVFSLFPAVGTGLIWVPVALYLFATGAIWQAVVLVGCGFFIVSSIDNILRPVLVGRDARMPDYVVLIATLGGFELMGFNGFVVGPVIAAMFMVAWQILGDTPLQPWEISDQQVDGA